MIQSPVHLTTRRDVWMVAALVSVGVLAISVEVGGHLPDRVDAINLGRRRFGQFILAGLTLLNVAGPARSDTAPRWKFTPGQKRTYVLTKKTAVKMEVMGRPTETNFTQTVDFTWEIKGVDSDGNADITQTIHHFKLQVVGPTENLEFNTTSPRMFRCCSSRSEALQVHDRALLR